MPQFLEKGQAYWWEVNKENAHNQFLQVSGEMGLVGLFVFVWVCVEIWAAYRRVRASGAQYESRGPAFALLVFGITALGAHPMIQMEIQVLFWILVALLFQSRSLLPEATPGRGPSRQEGFTWILAIGLFVVYAISGAVMARSFPPYHVYDLGMNSWEGKPWAEYFRWTQGSSLILLPRKFPHTKVKIELGWPAMGPDHSVSYRYQVDGDPPVEKTIGQHESQELLIDMVERTGNYVPLRVWVKDTWNRSRLPGSTDDRTLGIRVHAPEDREYLLGTTEGLAEPETFEGDSGRRFDASRAYLETFPDGRTILLPVFVEESAVGSRLRVYAGLDLLGEVTFDKPGWGRHHFRGHCRLDQPLLLTFRLVGTDTSPPLVRGVGGIVLGRILWLP
jgi:hypothetical protein